MKTLVTGGVRSGKSHHAEGLLSTAEFVNYVAPGPTRDSDPDPDWANRLDRHLARRPASWVTYETHDLAAALALPGPVIIDCLGTWLTARMDTGDLWEADLDLVYAAIEGDLGQAVAALADRNDDAVFVTNEVGLGVVPSHRSGRVFRDLLGTVNQSVAAACDEVHLVIAGRVLKL